MEMKVNGSRCSRAIAHLTEQIETRLQNSFKHRKYYKYLLKNTTMKF